MGIHEDLTLEKILGPESAEIARKVGSHKLRPVALEDLESPLLKELADFWNKSRDGMPLPNVVHLDPVKIPRVLSQAFLLDVEHDPMRFAFRLLSESTIGAFGVNVAGTNVEDIELDGTPVGQMMTEFYAWIAGQRTLVAMSGPNGALTDGYKRHEIVYLPFSNGGCKIVRLLGASVYYRD